MHLKTLALLAALANASVAGPVRHRDNLWHYRVARFLNETTIASPTISTSSSSFILNGNSAPSGTSDTLSTTLTTLTTQSLIRPPQSTTDTSTPAANDESLTTVESGQVSSVSSTRAILQPPSVTTTATTYSRLFTLHTSGPVTLTFPPVTPINQPSTSTDVSSTQTAPSSPPPTMTPSASLSSTFNPSSALSPTVSIISSSASSLLTGQPESIIFLPPSNVSESTTVLPLATSTSGFEASSFLTSQLGSTSSPSFLNTSVLSTALSPAATTLTQPQVTSFLSSPVITASTTNSARTTPTSILTATSVPLVGNNNQELAIRFNAVFATLTTESACNFTASGKISACVYGQLARCGSDGRYSLTACPNGQKCFALPLSSSQSGVTLQCDKIGDAHARLSQGIPSVTASTLAPNSTSSIVDSITTTQEAITPSSTAVSTSIVPSSTVDEPRSSTILIDQPSSVQSTMDLSSATTVAHRSTTTDIILPPSTPTNLPLSTTNPSSPTSIQTATVISGPSKSIPIITSASGSASAATTSVTDPGITIIPINPSGAFTVTVTVTETVKGRR